MVRRTPAELCRDDVAIDARTALLYPAEAPLTPAPGLRDARAVWTNTPARPDGSVLIYLHGHNNYVNVDAAGRPRIPDWATDDASKKGASAKPAAPLIYELDRLETKRIGKSPLVLVPEDAVHATGSFWAREPEGQYADPARLGRLIDDCQAHLSCLRRPDNHQSYLAAPLSLPRLRRVYLSGHSGAGLPMEEAARSAILLPETGVPAELWLFDCTYWSNVAGFVAFCSRWQAANRLRGADSRSARLVCIYRPKTSTEEVADALRQEVAKVLHVPANSLVHDHTPDSFEGATLPALTASPVLFVRTYLPHDDIPTFFIPALLRTAPGR